MCYDDQARPPEPPGAAGSARGEDLVLKASDDNQFSAYLATPSQPRPIQVLIYPDVRGLHQFYKELALRFAETGITALAIDYFGRTAGLTSRAEPFDYMPHVKQMTFATLIADARAGLAHLRKQSAPETSTFVLGFCMGGSATLLTGTEPDLGLAGLIPFYAGIQRTPYPDKGSALDNADQVRYPVLGLFGGADQGIPVELVHQLDEKLDPTGIEHNIVIYEGAPHSFFDRRATEFADASADAWKRVLDFMASHKTPVHS